jgi:mono/diheme cytochrome c family protein
MGKFVGGIIVGLILIPLAGAVYLLGGFAPAAVSDHPFPFERLIAGAALHARIQRDAPKRDLATFTTADLMAGAQTYRRGCGCHGMLEQRSTRPEPKMYPSPPHLLTPDGYVTDDPVGETYWKIKNGIRMTAMPSFQSVLSDDQMWQTAALVAEADKLPPEVVDVLNQPRFPPPTAPPATSSGEPNSNPNPVPRGGTHGVAPGSGITKKNLRPMSGAPVGKPKEPK